MSREERARLVQEAVDAYDDMKSVEKECMVRLSKARTRHHQATKKLNDYDRGIRV